MLRILFKTIYIHKLKKLFRFFSYNVLLCDKNTKLKNLPESNRISVGGSSYNEYEFFKFQVPIDYTDITKTYLKLMEMCSFSKLTTKSKPTKKHSLFKCGIEFSRNKGRLYKGQRVTFLLFASAEFQVAQEGLNHHWHCFQNSQLFTF